ncbi:MAG TPA: D-alanyl-D-alanine dipeptidase [Paenirhodobacter sp.]
MPDLSRTGSIPLVEISHPAITVALAYATPDNFTGRVLYSHSQALLRPEAARALYRAADTFALQGYGIVLLDAYRPASVQRMLWAARPDPDYVADPAIGSDHSRGTAVDLTLANAAGTIDMGTDFDTASVQSHHDRTDIPAPAIINRLILRGVMQASGFIHNPLEWWHYALPGKAGFPILDDTGGAWKQTPA